MPKATYITKIRTCKFMAVSLVLPLLVGASLICTADTYTGSLSSVSNEINGTGFWITDNDEQDWHGVTFSWTVSENLDLTWHYSYILDVYRAEVSHIIIETSDPFYNHDIFNASGPYDSLEIDSYASGGGQPYMPDDLYGVKFCITEGTNITISFDSLRMPVWGDFYAKCGAVGGTQNTAWNVGFTASDTDPSDLPSNGSVDYHVLVPDSAIPEPGTIALFGLGLVGLGAKLRRRKES